jgi:hypothetical protein
MRIIEAPCLAAVLICAMIAFAGGTTAASDDYSGLIKLISETEDVRMNAQDLAFFLATHDFDATPKGDYAIVKLDSRIYKVVPNGAQQGLADVLALD